MRAGKARQLSEEEAEEADFARLQRWDAEIEAEFRRTVAATKTAGRKKRGHRLVGFPFAFLVDVCRLTGGRATLVVAALTSAHARMQQRHGDAARRRAGRAGGYYLQANPRETGRSREGRGNPGPSLLLLSLLYS